MKSPTHPLQRQGAGPKPRSLQVFAEASSRPGTIATTRRPMEAQGLRRAAGAR